MVTKKKKRKIGISLKKINKLLLKYYFEMHVTIVKNKINHIYDYLQ